MEEKEYVFTSTQGDNGPIVNEKVKESQLTKQQKDLLLGHIIHEFNKLPEEIKIRFMHHLSVAIQENRQPNKREVELMNTFIYKLDKEIDNE